MPGSDPLAELARLIGQSDPFSDFGGKQPQQNAASQEAAAAREPRHYFEPRLVEPEPADWRASQPSDPVRLSPRPLQSIFPDAVSDPRDQMVPPGSVHFHPPSADDGRLHGATDDEHVVDDPGYDPAHARAHQETDAVYPEDQHVAHGDAAFEDHAPARRRGGIVTVLAVLGLAVVGTAAAFGYRAVFNNPTPAGAPPVIRADATPSKVVPSTQPNEAQSSKLIYDRVGDRGQNEKVVTREEQPVAIKDPSKSPPARVVFPGTSAPPISPPAAALPPSATALAATPPAPVNPTSASTEPKKIRTVTIRPEQPVAVPEVATTRPVAPPPAARVTNGSNVPAPATAAAPLPEPSRSVSRVASAPPPSAEPEPPAPARAPAARAVPPPAPAVSNAPLSLAPASNGRPANARVAARTPSSGGAYAVQVSSQRSEAEAQTSFRSLQAKFPNELGGRQATIRRADLGDKGIFFRAQVGPFASAEEANEFCGNLKSAGGQCVVQRN